MANNSTVSHNIIHMYICIARSNVQYMVYTYCVHYVHLRVYLSKENYMYMCTCSLGVTWKTKAAPSGIQSLYMYTRVFTIDELQQDLFWTRMKWCMDMHMHMYSTSFFIAVMPWCIILHVMWMGLLSHYRHIVRGPRGLPFKVAFTYLKCFKVIDALGTCKQWAVTKQLRHDHKTLSSI